MESLLSGLNDCWREGEVDMRKKGKGRPGGGTLGRDASERTLWSLMGGKTRDAGGEFSWEGLLCQPSHHLPLALFNG